MKAKTVDRKLRTARSRLKALSRQIAKGPARLNQALPDLLKQFHHALEEMEAADENVRRQHEELIAARRALNRKRRQVEQARREAEAKYRVLVEQIPAITYTAALDELGRTLYISPQIETMLGFSADEWLADPELWSKQIHPDDRARVLVEYVRSYTSGELFQCEYRLFARDGRTKWFRDEAQAVRDETGRPLFTQGVMLDITKHRQAEEQLQHAATQLRFLNDLVEQTAQPLGVTTLEGQIVRFNRAFEHLTGYRADELRAMTYVQLTPERWHERESQLVAHLLATGESVRYEKEYRRKDGTIVPVELVVDLYRNAAGEPEYFYAFVTDITERKQAEAEKTALLQRNESLVKALGEIVYDWRPLSGEVIWDGDYTRILGYTEQEIGHDTNSWMSRVHPDDLDCVLAEVERAAQERRLYDLEYRFRRRDGGYRWMHDRGVLFLNPEGTLERIVGVFRDITERKQAEEELRQSQQQLHDILDSMFAFVGLFTLDGVLVEANRAPLQAAGLEREDVIGKPFAEIYWWSHSSQAQTRIREALRRAAHGETVRDDFLGRVAGDRIIVVDATFSPLYDATGRVYMVVGSGVDITERKQAEEALREALEFNQQIITSVQEGIVVFDRDLRCRVRNQFMEKLTGIPTPEVLGKRLWELSPALTEEVFRPLLERALAGETLDGPDLNVPLSSTAQAHWTSRRFSPLCSAGGDIIGVIAVIHDITERKRAEAALRDSEAKFSSAFYSNPAMLALATFDGKTVDANQAYADFLGCSREEILGKSVVDLQVVSMEERQKILDLIQQAGGSVHNAETAVRVRDGSLRHILFSIEAISIGGVPHRLTTILDITDRKRAEEAERRARHITEMLTAANLALTQTLDLDVVLEKLLDYLGQLVPYDSASIMLLEDDSRLAVRAIRGYERWTDPELVSGLRFDLQDYPNLHTAVTAGQSFLVWNTYEYPGWDHALAGMEYVQNWLGVPLVAGGQIIGLYSMDKAEPGFFTAEHVRLAEALAAQAAVAIQNALLHEQVKRHTVELERRVAERTADLRTANRELESFSYSVSHDLRAPLRAISGFAEILTRRHRPGLDEEGQQYLNNVVEASARMGQLIDDLLEYSRIGRGAVRRESVPLGQALQRVAQDLAGRIADTGARLSLPDDLPVVRGDRTLLSQIFTNLLDNALTYWRPGVVPQLAVSWRAEAGQAVIGVSDNGIGIRPEYHDKIFNVFQRLHSEEQYPGTGIGLAIVKKSVELLGGRVWVESVVGQGSTFWVELPMADLQF
jgi:PAS domain S-box-containing protein